MRGPGPLSWAETRLTLQLLAEERTGWVARQRAYDARAQEDAVWSAAVGATGAQ